MRQRERSEALARRAARTTPGGVHSNVRLTAPRIFFDRAEGAWLHDVDGNDYVDHLLGQGPNFLGHAPPQIVGAVAEACRCGTLFGGQHRREVEASEAVIDAIGWADMVRFGVSGTEMVHEALRLARAYTGRRRLVRFEGHYHGWLDNVLLADRGGVWGPASEGQYDSHLEDQIVLPWNDADAVDRAFTEHGDEIAAVITEPMMVNVGAISPRPGYLEHLRTLTEKFGAVLIFDEVITGFRLALGGGAERFGVQPDLATYGKAMAGGWPVAALAGRSELMEMIGTGAVNHSGTFNSSVMAMASVISTLDELRSGAAYEAVEAHGTALMGGLRDLGERHGVELRIEGLPAAFHVTIGSGEVHDARSLAAIGGTAGYARLADLLVAHGVWVAARGVWYTSAAHGTRELTAVLERADAALGAYTADG